jgi:hypothetical protein
MKTEGYRIKNNGDILIAIYELDNGNYYGLIMTAPLYTTEENPKGYITAEGKEFQTEESKSKETVLQTILDKLKITVDDIELM